MKELKLMTMLIIMGLIVQGCNSATPEEKKIIGKYSLSYIEEIEATDESPAGTISIEGTEEFQKDKAVEMDYTLRVLYELEEEEYFNVITLEFKIKANGIWKHENKKLNVKCNPQSIVYDSVKSSATVNDEVSQNAIKVLKQYINTALIPELKSSLSSTYDIIELEEDKMVLEDEDGEQVTYTKF